MPRLRLCVFARAIVLLVASVAAAGEFPRVQVVPQPNDAVSFEYDGHEVLRYNYGADTWRPYFYPVIGPAGRPVTRLTHPHEPFSHRHHLSLWIAHQNVDGVNLWEISDKAGRVIQEKIAKIDDGKIGLLVTQSKWQDAQGKVLMKDERTWRYIPREGAPGEFFLDLELTLM